jgi:arginase family enzyme
LVGVDVVEVAPSLEATAATSLIGIRIAVEAKAFHAGASL